MKKALLFLSVIALFVGACTPENKEEGDGSIYGEWSTGMADGAGNMDIRMHLSLTKNGKFVLTMPAWLDQRLGTFEIKGNELILTVTELNAVFLRPGYRNVYEQYLDWPSDSEELPTFADWAKERADQVVMNVEFSLEEDGLHLGGLFGMLKEEAWFLDPDFDAFTECKKHYIYD